MQSSITGIGSLVIVNTQHGLAVVIANENNKNKHYTTVTQQPNAKYYEDFGGKVDTTTFYDASDYALMELYEESACMFSVSHLDLLRCEKILQVNSTFMMYLMYLNLGIDINVLSTIFQDNLRDLRDLRDNEKVGKRIF
jgi:hypothetical protein